MTALTRLRLKNFRNYESLSLDLDGRHVCLFGSNGAGKTNLLEAISQLGPGRGLRSASLSELTRHGAESGWTISANLDDRRIGVGLEADGVHDHEIWFVPPEGELVSLGVVTPGEVVAHSVPESVARTLHDGSQLLLTREPLGGKPEDSAAGPVVAEAEFATI